MDLESECSALDFVEDNEATQRTISHVDDNKIKDNHVDKDNGSRENDNQTQRLSPDQSVDSDALTADNLVKGAAEIVHPMQSHPLEAKSLGGPSPSTTKGYGLKKWRRIKRDFVKDSTATMDRSKILKRGLSASANPTKPQHMASPEIKQNSEPPVGPVNMLKNASVAPGFMMRSPSSDSRFAVGVAFAAATESENSEDRSSMSFAAASMPKVRFELPAVLGNVNEKNQMNNLSGKTVGNISQRVQQGKGRVESSKKPRGERRSHSSDSRFAVGAAFATAIESENSEDRSSMSFRAASMPKVRYDLPAVLGHVNEKNQMNRLSGKTVGTISQRVQQEKGRSKKPRGERVKIKKENSRSSMESDSRSSNFVLMQGPFSVTSNGKNSGNSMNYNGKNSDEAREDKDQISEEVQTAYRKENSGEIEELSPDDLAAGLSWEAKEEKGENHRLSPDQDPMLESILALQSVQEALENEVQKLGEIGIEPISVHDDSANINIVHVDSTFGDQEILETSSSDQLASEKITKSISGSLETQVFTLTHKVKYLESKLEEARAVLQVKESRISELEPSVNSSRSRKEESGSTAELQQDKYREMEFDLEGLFQQKMEAEIEFLALTKALQKLRVSVGNQIKLFEEQTSLAGEQAQTLNKLGEAESKAAILKKQAEELEKYCGDVLGTDEVLKMQRSVCKVTSCFFTQMVLLVLVLLSLVLQWSPLSGVVVPT